MRLAPRVRDWLTAGSAPGWAALLAGLALLAVYLGFERHRLRQADERRFAVLADRSAAYLQGQIGRYDDALHMLRAKLESDDAVDPAEFSDHCARADLLSRLPGALVASYAAHVVDGRLHSGAAAPPMWTDNPGLTRRVMPPSGEHFPILMRHPASADLIGYDLGNVPDFRAAFELASRTGEVAASDPVALGDPRNNHYAILLTLPVRATGGARGVAGFVSLGVDTPGLFSALVTPGLAEIADLEIRSEAEGGARQSLFQLHAGSPAGGTRAAFSESRELAVAGRVWRISFASLPAFDAASRRALAWQAGMGLAMCLLAALLLGRLSADRHKLKAERKRLAASEAEKGALLQRIADGFIALDAGGAVQDRNPRARELLGSDHLPPEADSAIRLALDRARAAGEPEPFDCPDSRGGWIRGRVYPAADGASVYFHDATAERQAQRAELDALAAHERRATLLLELTRSQAMRDGDLPGLFAAIVEAAVSGLSVTRAGLWFFNAEGTALACEDLYRVGAGHAFGETLDLTRAPAYAAALADTLLIAADDAQQDPRTAELADEYLRPAGITSRLDIPLRRAGRLAGVLAIEQCGLPRHWNPADQSYAAALVEVASIALETAERRIAERAHAESEREYREIFDTAPLGIYQLDPGGRVVAANAALAALLGYPEAAALHGVDFGRDLLFDFAECAGLLARHVPGGEGGRVEVRFKRRDGNPVWVQLDAHALSGSRGGIRRLEGFVHDITARRDAEEALRRTADELRLTIEALPDIYLRCDREGRILAAHAGDPGDLLAPVGQLVGILMDDLLPPALKDRHQAALAEMRAGRGAPFEYELEFPDGRRYFEARLMPLPAGEWLAIIRNITDRHTALNAMRQLTSELELRVEERTRELARAGEALRERTEMLDAVTEGTSDAIYVKDLAGRYRFINSAGARVFARTPAEVVGRTDAELMEAASARAIRRTDEAILSTGALQMYDDEITGPAGRMVFFTIKGVMHGPDGKVSGLFGISRDITERRRQEEVVERMALDLRARNTELQRLNDELEAFAGSVAHDLKSPLQTILGYTDALRTDSGTTLGRDGGEFVARIDAAVGRLTELLDGLHTLARAARAGLSHERVDLTALAGEVLAELRRRDPERRVETVVAPGLAATGDPRMLRSLLENLLGNAWKFTARVPVARIEFLHQADERGGEFMIRDNGAGFDPLRSARLFRPFQRLHDARDFPGTGVGLATVARIVSRHGGRIRAEGRPGEGASFRFTLPG